MNNPFLDPTGEEPLVLANNLIPVCGFRPMNEAELIPQKPKVYTECDDKGYVTTYKIEDGHKIQLEKLGHVRTLGNKQMYKTFLMSKEELEQEPDPDTPVMALTARQLALNALNGDKQSITEIHDRILGKPKQVTENYSVVKTIDDVLNEVFDENDEPIIPIDAEHVDE